MFKILRLADRPTVPLDGGDRGAQTPLVDAALGTENLDVHLNRLRPGGGRGPLHRHSTADNVYIVRRGTGALTVEAETHTIVADDVVFIPAGVRHALANAGEDELELFEIYAPAGRKFDFLVEEC